MKLIGKKILVTGGAGFIGSHLVEALAKNNQVTVYDNFSSSVVSLSYLSSLINLRVIKGDIRSSKLFDKSMAGIDVIFHLAVACVRLSISSPLHVHEINATGTLQVLLAAQKARVKRFVYVSSSEVYGSAQKKLIDENHLIDPTTVYGTSKFIGELYTRLFHRQGLPAVIIRPFNSYGPRSHFDGVYGEVIPRWCVRALSGAQPIIFGNGTQTRDFTYIDDTVEGIILAAQSDKLLGETVNIAFGREVKIIDIAAAICKLAGLSFKPIYKAPRPSDVDRLPADISKAKRLLGYKPQISIKPGLGSYLSWLKQTFPDPHKLARLIPEKNW